MSETEVPRDKAAASQLIAQLGGPAFIRRARLAEAAWEGLCHNLAATRAGYLDMVRLRVGLLFAVAPSTEVLIKLVGVEQMRILQAIHDECQPQLRAPVDVATSRGELEQLVQEFNESLARFARRWREHLKKADLASVNQRRDEYNRYYLLEKECALSSSHLARKGFQPLAAATLADLENRFPVWPIIVLVQPSANTSQ